MGRRYASPAAIAIRAAGHARAALEYHARECPRCAQAIRETLPMRYCDVGWILAKSDARATNAANAARDAEVSPKPYGQPELPLWVA